jgi:hypothetical protein
VTLERERNEALERERNAVLKRALERSDEVKKTHPTIRGRPSKETHLEDRPDRGMSEPR